MNEATIVRWVMFAALIANAAMLVASLAGTVSAWVAFTVGTVLFGGLWWASYRMEQMRRENVDVVREAQRGRGRFVIEDDERDGAAR